MNTPALPDARHVEHLAETSVRDCYQCGKCAAGCPMAEQMDLLPNQLIRLVQLGRIERAMRADSLWKCVSCMTCSTRCPKEVRCAEVLDALRQLAVEHDVASEARRRTILFQQVFLENIRRNGRLQELELVRMFKTRGFLADRSLGLLMKDAMLGPKMLARGKLHLLGRKAKDRGVIGRIFERCMTNGNRVQGSGFRREAEEIGVRMSGPSPSPVPSASPPEP